MVIAVIICGCQAIVAKPKPLTNMRISSVPTVAGPFKYACEEIDFRYGLTRGLSFW